MFFLFKKDSLRELREQSRSVLHHARRVRAYRCDLWSEEERERFDAERAAVETLTKGKEFSTEEMQPALERLEATLQELGGPIYPNRLIPEWVELIVVAAIVAGGIRAFFLQPFKIPTNSMYPTYHGMTAEVYPVDGDGPGPGRIVWGKITQWAKRIEVRAPQGAAGEVWIPLSAVDGPVQAVGSDGGILGTGLLAGASDVYLLQIGETQIPVTVPKDFDFLTVLLKTYFPEQAKLPVGTVERWRKVLETARTRGDVVARNGSHFLRTRHNVREGGRLVHFSILTGDMVFVDRMSYNFVRPKLGDPFVFATKNIPGLSDNRGNPQDLYYIKRLAGLPGDTLQVRSPVLYRNGAPIEGKPAFEKNNQRRLDLEYMGYFPNAGGSLYAQSLREARTVPEAHYYALGDNSGNSFDSRGWGFVPEKEVIGRGFFILYPFTNRWGLAE